MSLLSPTAPAFDQVCVALDLETTGLDENRDTIIEVGAVKFQGDQVIDTFQTFVNPGRTIPDFIQRLTGISPNQVARAPFFSTISDDLEQFVEQYPVVGHNVNFDLKFLAAHGLVLNNVPYDTWDLASMFLPNHMQYSLSNLTSHLKVSHINAHRALDDARATHGVFVALLRRAAELDPGLITYMMGLATRSRWAIAPLLNGLENETSAVLAPSAVGLTGLDLETISKRLSRPEKRRMDSSLGTLDENNIVDLLGAKGPFAQAFSGFEHRPEQDEMLSSVAKAIYQSRHLVVEGATGVGKSMAYLLPAVLFAVARGGRVVVSTKTINLQEQLLRKDIPALIEVLEGAGLVEKGVVQAASLKGKSNYLCLRRWNQLARSDNVSVDDARLLGKTAVWLQTTVTGDRSEINLSGRDAFTWNRVSAGEKGWCPGMRDGSPCFMRSAHERAEQAHIIVVNHALLLSDMVMGGNLIPDYQYLIVDEAHSLEDEATSQLGFQVSADSLEQPLENQGRLSAAFRLALRGEEVSAAVRQEGERVVADVESKPPHLKELWTRVWAAAERLLESQSGDGQSQLLLTADLRSQRGWDEMSLAWENQDLGLQQATQAVSRLHRFLDTTELPGASDQATITSEAAGIQDNLEKLRTNLGAVLTPQTEDSVLWIARNQGRGEISFHSAPLDVAATLQEQLFNRKESVVLTSATLSTDGTFGHFRRRTGVPEDSEELQVGTPFDYRKAALLLIPEDMPQPNADGYLQAVSRVLVDLAGSLGGHTMALFTSYSALRGVSQRVRTPLQGHGVEVFAQGIDGSAPQLMSRFRENPKSLLLGTSSFWEGVDLPSGALKALVLTRLPFQVPTDPIVKARSDQYKEPFNEYSIPQAVLRFRQGIGRLIRNKEDRGVIVVLDKRITARSYGKSFLQSIPPCTLQPCNLATVGMLTSNWIGVSGSAGSNRATGR
jgi:DNA polymerase-3 subunit epsilon/ATP-dependent DNA helicase DinG